MTILPGLTSTKSETISAFIEDLVRHSCKTIALFPTTLSQEKRTSLYADLERVPELKIPHVHLRSDFSESEMDYLVERFQTEVFNIHPKASEYPFVPESGRYLKRIFIENVEKLPERDELAEFGGLCPDFSHWENGKLNADPMYDGFEDLFAEYPVGCCHLSAIRLNETNPYNGGFDHHNFKQLSDLEYLVDYQRFFPRLWLSLELENPLPQQLEAKRYLESRFKK